MMLVGGFAEEERRKTTIVLLCRAGWREISRWRFNTWMMRMLITATLLPTTLVAPFLLMLTHLLVLAATVP